MSHKTDKKRHHAQTKTALRAVKKKYLALTRNNTLTPDNFDREVQDPDLKQQILKCCRRLARRQVYMPLYPLVKDRMH